MEGNFEELRKVYEEIRDNPIHAAKKKELLDINPKFFDDMRKEELNMERKCRWNAIYTEGYHELVGDFTKSEAENKARELLTREPERGKFIRVELVDMNKGRKK